jgi:hypothetical protein
MKSAKPRRNGIIYGMAYDELTDEEARIANEVTEYLSDLISPEQLQAVQKILGMNVDGDDPNATAMDSLPQRLRQETLDRQHKAYIDRFPNAQRLK